MADIVIGIEKFKNELSKASSDCWLEGGETRTYGIELSRLIDVIFDCLIKTDGSWVSQDSIILLIRKLIQKGFKKKTRYNSEKELSHQISIFNNYKAISGAEKKVFDALSGLSSNYRWEMYLAIYEFIDSFLW
jgi:hypothetical protein